MPIRGTSNQSIATISRDGIKGQSYETAGGDDTGGVGFGVAGVAEYREIDNSTGSLGMVFTHSSEHLPEGTPQADRQPA